MAEPLAHSERSDSDRRWLAEADGTVVLGPFESDELAMKVREYVEKVRGREDLWIMNAADLAHAKSRS